MKQKIKKISAFMQSLKSDCSGVAMIEFAISLPLFIGLTVGGFEMAHYARTIMKINQLTIHTADNAARMGDGSLLTDQKISETNINDIFAGTIREGETLLLDGEYPYVDPSTGVTEFRGNALITLSSVEDNPNYDPSDPDTGKYHVPWQRCVGKGSQFKAKYADEGDTSNDGFGPDGQKISPPQNGAIMFAELQYRFEPLIMNGFTILEEQTISQHASMVVRESRDFTQIYNSEGANISACP